MTDDTAKFEAIRVRLEEHGLHDVFLELTERTAEVAAGKLPPDLYVVGARQQAFKVERDGFAAANEESAEACQFFQIGGARRMNADADTRGRMRIAFVQLEKLIADEFRASTPDATFQERTQRFSRFEIPLDELRKLIAWEPSDTEVAAERLLDILGDQARKREAIVWGAVFAREYARRIGEEAAVRPHEPGVLESVVMSQNKAATDAAHVADVTIGALRRSRGEPGPDGEEIRGRGRLVVGVLFGIARELESLDEAALQDRIGRLSFEGASWARQGIGLAAAIVQAEAGKVADGYKDATT